MHLSIGEEAIPAGTCLNLEEGDQITSTHRGHGHCIARGADLGRMMAELLAKDDGYCRGRGGSMHIADVATDPAHQRRGIGRAVMEHLIDRIDQAAPPHPYITLMADPPGQRLYRSLGFVDSAPSLGMRLPR